MKLSTNHALFGMYCSLESWWLSEKFGNYTIMKPHGNMCEIRGFKKQYYQLPDVNSICKIYFQFINRNYHLLIDILFISVFNGNFFVFFSLSLLQFYIEFFIN